MTRRMLLCALALVTVVSGAVAAHEGHEHKILGTVTMAASDHVMLKDKAGKDVTVHITDATKVLRDKKPAAVADIKTGMRVMVTAVTEKKDNVERGLFRDGEPLDDDNTVRTIVSFVDLGTGEERLDRRIDIDDHDSAIAAAFYSFLPTAYLGLSELGLIAGTGIIIAFATTVTLLPALLKVLKPSGEQKPIGYTALAPLDRFLDRQRNWIVGLTLGAGADIYAGFGVDAGYQLLIFTGKEAEGGEMPGVRYSGTAHLAGFALRLKL